MIKDLFDRTSQERILDSINTALDDFTIPVEDIADRYVRCSTSELRQQLISAFSHLREVRRCGSRPAVIEIHSSDK